MDNLRKEYDLKAMYRPEQLKTIKVMEYCKEQGIPVGPPSPGQDTYVYSIDMNNLNGIQMKMINNILNG